MIFCMVTDRLSPHEISLAAQLAQQLGKDSFRYIVSRSLDVERTKLGWTTDHNSWIIEIGESEDLKSEAVKWIKESDIVLFGNRQHELIAWRIARNKITFYGSERWFKPPLGLLRLFHLKFVHLFLKYFRLSKSNVFYYLALGKYAACDMRTLRLFKNNIYNWGYFVAPSDPVVDCRKRIGPLRVLWVGRMLAWKRVDSLITAVNLLSEEVCDISLKLVGQGVEEGKLRQLAGEQITEFERSVPIEKVRLLMRDADVYVLPSTGYEGWGVVVNEAMLEGCAVIASRESGAGITLINHKKNGLLFNSGDVEDLVACIRSLDNDEIYRRKLAKAGQETVLNEWAPSIAVQRLISFSDALLTGCTPSRWPSGPLSRG